MHTKHFYQDSVWIFGCILMIWVECMKHKKLRSTSSRMPFYICLLLFKNYISELVFLACSIFL